MKAKVPVVGLQARATVLGVRKAVFGMRSDRSGLSSHRPGLSTFTAVSRKVLPPSEDCCALSPTPPLPKSSGTTSVWVQMASDGSWLGMVSVYDSLIGQVSLEP